MKHAKQLSTATSFLIFILIAGCSSDDPNPTNVDPVDCETVSCSFDNGLIDWNDVSSGPGVSNGVVEVQGLDTALLMDSLNGSNYYLDLYRDVDAEDCLSGSSLSWYWAIDNIESPYGLACVFVEFFSAAGNHLGTYTVRRHTGSFPAYSRTQFVSNWINENPGKALKVDDATGSSFSAHYFSVTFGSAFFSSFDVLTINPDQVATLRIWLRSYNNAGSGVEMYVDDVVVAL